MDDKKDVIPGHISTEQFTKDGFKVLMEAIKHSNALPSGRDWDFYNTSESFKKIINDESNNIMRLMNRVMKCNDLDNNIRNRVLDEKIELIIEANDVILERVANNIDELNGIRKSVIAPIVLQTVSAELPVNGAWNRTNSTTFTVNSTVPQSSDKNCIKLLTAKNIIRPQKFFKDQIDNRNRIPWQPRITDKPNSLKPLAIFLEECDDRQEFSHPYEYELDRFAPTTEQLLEEKPKLPKALSDTPLIEIDKFEQLEELVETLRECKEFAVDVEHHSYRSFMGITCLLQISTQDNDYIIDTLALRDKLHVLNDVFTKNTIVKIFHGADKDIEWLQRDLSIYVVNMFDTHQAAKLLQYQGLSLAFLMKKFCNILPNKQFQLADWRIRPLPDELKQYAREDTHYLIYIYKMLKLELLSKANKSDNLLKSVIERSTDLCKKRYFKPLLLEDSYMEIYRKCKKMFDNRQLFALKEIFSWRDNLAREEDESLGYVLPNHMMLQISETLPREMQGILACCNPIPPLVRSNLLQLHHIVLKAREQPLEKKIMKDTTGRGVLKEISKVNVDSALHCPHDLSKSSEFRDDLPTLLKRDDIKTDNQKLLNTSLRIEKPPLYTVFSAFEPEDKCNKREILKKLRSSYFSPYERYKLVKPFVVAEETATDEQNNQKEEPVVNDSVNNMEPERTDEERIASIKDHFMQLSKKFSEDLQAQKQKEEAEQRLQERSLIEMGGTRKRRREDECDCSMETSVTNNLHSSIPNINKGKRSRARKRKFEELDYQDADIAQDVTHKKRNRKRRNAKQQKQFNGDQQTANCQVQQQQFQQPKQKKRKYNQQQSQQNFGNQNFTPYDYSSVDFRQFQGGAGSANSGTQIKHTWKGKNRKNKNKNGAKSAIFAGAKQQRGGQHNRNY